MARYSWQGGWRLPPRSSRPPGARPSRGLGTRQGWEFLESRLAPAVSTWSGAVSALWSAAGNWDVPPVAGSDLVFPAGAANLTSTNDLAAGTSFASLTMAGAGYALGGNAISLTGGLDASSAGTDTVNLPVTFTGTSAASVSVDQAGALLVLGGALSGSGGLTKTGAGVLDLTGVNDYSGTTTVSAGALNVDTAQGSSPVELNSGTTLGGTGTVGAITSTSGTIRPGDPAPGALNDSGSLSLDAGSTFAVQLNSAAAGSGYSQLVVAGAVNLGGAQLAASAGFTPTGNAAFTILDNTGSNPVSGTFAGLAEGATLTVGGQSYRISYVGGDGNDVVLTHLAASTTTVSSSAASVVAGQAVTLSATVASADSTETSTPTGTVEFFDGTTALGTGTLSAGVATLPGVVLAVGSHSLTAQYQGDTSFATSTSNATTQTVTQASSTTTLTASPDPSGIGQSVALTATVAAASPGSGIPTGTVQFSSGTTSLGTATLDNTGTATLNTTALGVGSDDITAQYSGDTNFTASASSVVTQTVVEGTTTTTLAVSNTHPASTDPVTLTATVAAAAPSTATPTGTVVYYANGQEIGTGTLSGGQATFTASGLKVGNVTLSAVYQGDASNAGAASAGTAIVVGTADERFLNQVYRAVLARDADPAGLQAWVTQLQNGVTRQSVVRSIVNSQEARNLAQQYAQAAGNRQPTPYLAPSDSRTTKVDRINNDYQAILARPADSQGLQYYLGVVDHDGDGHDVAVDMLSSDEYYARATSTGST